MPVDDRDEADDNRGAPKPAEDEVLDVIQPDKPVKVRLADGTVKQFVIKEMDTPTLTKWQRIASERFPTDGRGRPLKDKADFDGLQADLIALCLFDPETGKSVPYKVIKGWGTAIQNRLFMMCRKHNALDDDADDREGKG